MKKPKKRGRKPGVKVGPYKNKAPISLDSSHYVDLFKKANAKIGDTLRIRLPDDYIASTTQPMQTRVAEVFLAITNSEMDQSTKVEAFKALAVHTNNF